MIYEMVNDHLQILEQQWNDLAVTFQLLAQAPPGSSLPAPFGNPDPNGPPVGLQLDCVNAAFAVEGVRAGIEASRPEIDPLLMAAATAFAASDTALQPVIATFEGLVFSTPSATDSAEVTDCRRELTNLRDLIGRGRQDLGEIMTPAGQRFNIRGIHGAVDNLASYPILTSGNGAYPAMPATAASGGGSMARTIDDAMREVLGRNPRPNDTRSFIAALTQSFTITQFEGQSEYAWVARGYAGQTELGGGVSGSQASLYTRAKVALNNVLPLLDGLTSLLSDSDPQLVSAGQAVVRAQLTELVNEMAAEGGPRVARVDRFFEVLLEQEISIPDRPSVQGGYLGYLQETLGLKPIYVNTLEEESNLTNFVVLRDYVHSLRESWTGFIRDSYGRDLGTGLVRLSRALSVTAEAVDEVYAAMDSVYVGPAERQVAGFQDGGNGFILIEELLSWIKSFSMDEAPMLVRDGGRRGVEAIGPTANRLSGLTRTMLQNIQSDPQLPEGLRHPRVRNPLQELRGYLEQVQQLAQNIRQEVAA